jgi:hypothetical protein
MRPTGGAPGALQKSKQLAFSIAANGHPPATLRLASARRNVVERSAKSAERDPRATRILSPSAGGVLGEVHPIFRPTERPEGEVGLPLMLYYCFFSHL